MGTTSPEKALLIQKFASSQVKFQSAKFGIQVKDRRYPISHITIDSEGILHGWNVQVHGQQQKQITATKELQSFANDMKGTMKVHSVLIRTMKDPDVHDHN